MIYQTDGRLRLEARDDECFLFTILKMFEEATEHTFTVDEIDKIHSLLVQMDYVKINGWVNERGARGIAQIASGFTAKHCYIKQVKDDEMYTHVVAKWIRPAGSKTWTHFVNMTMDKQAVAWDPYSQAGSRTVRDGSIDSYRYFYVEAI